MVDGLIVMISSWIIILGHKNVMNVMNYVYI